MRASSRKRHLLANARGHLQENAIFSKMHAAIFKKTSSSRKCTRPSSRKRNLLEDACGHLQENAIFSKMHAAIFEKLDSIYIRRRPYAPIGSSIRIIERAASIAGRGSSSVRPTSRDDLR